MPIVLSLVVMLAEFILRLLIDDGNNALVFLPGFFREKIGSDLVLLLDDFVRNVMEVRDLLFLYAIFTLLRVCGVCNYRNIRKKHLARGYRVAEGALRDVHSRLQALEVTVRHYYILFLREDANMFLSFSYRWIDL